MSNAEAVIDAVHLTKHYGRRRGIEDVAFTVQRGEIFGFLGPNGAGKTTTIRAVLGLVHPHHGRVTIFGHPASEIDRSRLGFVPGELSLYERMTGAQLLDYLAALTRRPPLRRAALLERFALSRQDLLRPIRHYSRGMKQKVGVVQALQHDPELLVLDEPAEGLDPLMQQEFYELLGELRAEGRTVFISSHLLWEVERICDRVAIIRDGLLVTTERIDTLRQRSARRVDVQFAQANDATAFRPPEGVTVERVEGVRLTLRVPAERTAAVLDALAGIYCAAIVLFEYLLVVVYETLGTQTLGPVLQMLPPGIQALLGNENARLLTPGGFLAFLFMHPFVLVLMSAFPIAFASGALAGEVERRTIALILTRPISRRQVAGSVALTMTIGVATMCAALWGGLAMVTRIRGFGPINLVAFGWAAASGAAAFWAVGGVALLSSAAASEAGRAGGVSAAFTLASYVADYVAKLSPDWRWLKRYSLFAYWDPQGVVARGGVVWSDVAVLLGVAALTVLLGIVVFDRRDVAV